MLKIGSIGYIDGERMQILDAKRWGKVWVYKVKFGNKNSWIEYLTKKEIGFYQEL